MAFQKKTVKCNSTAFRARCFIVDKWFQRIGTFLECWQPFTGACFFLFESIQVIKKVFEISRFWTDIFGLINFFEKTFLFKNLFRLKDYVTVFFLLTRLYVSSCGLFFLGCKNIYSFHRTQTIVCHSSLCFFIHNLCYLFFDLIHFNFHCFAIVLTWTFPVIGWVA